jgi:hypothetical protein
LIGARADRLVLVTVKSFLASRGAVPDHVTGNTTNERWKRLYALLNNQEIRDHVVNEAANRYGCSRRRATLVPDCPPERLCGSLAA